MPKEVVLSMCAFAQQSNEEAVSVNTDGFSHQSYVFSSHIIFLFKIQQGFLLAMQKLQLDIPDHRFAYVMSSSVFLWEENVPLSHFFLSVGIL